MSGLDVLLGEEGPQMRRILLSQTNCLASKAKCCGFEFHQASSEQEGVSHRVLLISARYSPVPHGRRPLLLRFHCGAFEVRGGRVGFSANAPAAAAQNGRMVLDQLPGAGHDDVGGTWPRRRSAGGIGLASAGLHD